ncbi:MAG: hypothetical protein AAF485_20305, partial [Chloroflexota bacterium]
MAISNDLDWIAQQLKASLDQYHKHNDSVTLGNIVPHLLSQAEAQQMGEPSHHNVANQLLLDLLGQLAAKNSDAGKLLRAHYVDHKTGTAVANMFAVSESGFYRRRKKALLALAQIAVTQEQLAQATYVNRLESRLEPSTYQQLFGLADLQQTLTPLLQHTASETLICLTGIGGIG